MRIPFFHNILRLIRPRVRVAGLVVGRSSLVCTVTDQDRKVARSYSVPLASPLITSDGVVRADECARALQSLRAAMGYSRVKDLSVILSLSDEYVYTQTFSLPSLKGSALHEAVDLNMEMISPIRKENRYAGWQLIDDQSDQKTILASFIEKNTVDSLTAVFAQERVSVVAIEQQATSVARLLAVCDKNYSAQDSYFVFRAGDDGMSFSIVHSGVAEFNRFSPWGDAVVGGASSGTDRSISFENFSALILQESSRILNYYSSRSGHPLSVVYVLAPGLEEKVSVIFRENLSLQVRLVQLRCYTDQQQWPVSLGAALRGDIPRSADRQISLAPEGTQERFMHAQIISFIVLWRNVFAIVFSVVLLACFATFLFLHSFSETIVRDLTTLTGTHNIAALEELQSEAKHFNGAISIALSAQQQQNRWADVVDGVYGAAGTVLIDRFYIQSVSQPVTINARAANEQQAIAFKNRVEQISGISQVDLPLSSVTPAQGGQVAFQLSFRVAR